MAKRKVEAPAEELDMDEIEDRSARKPPGPKEAAQLIRRSESIIINEWLEVVVKTVPAAKRVGRSELANHLLELLINLTEAMESIDPDFDFEQAHDLPIASSSQLHARARSSSADYTLN